MSELTPSGGTITPMSNEFKGRTGFDRLMRATGYSLAGLKTAYRGENAFRLEAWFVTLPVHLGLLVKVNPEGFPSEVNGLPAGGILIVHNSHVHGMSAKELGETMSGQWKPERPSADVLVGAVTGALLGRLVSRLGERFPRP